MHTTPRTHTPSRMYCLTALYLAGVLLPAVSFAGTGGQELAPVWNWLVGIVQGYGGKIAALVFILAGLAGGARYGSVMVFLAGLFIGIGLYLAPDIINSMVTATLAAH